MKQEVDKMEINSVITLEDGEKCELLDKVTYEK